MIALEAHPEGTILPVKAHAGARSNEIKAARSGNLQVSVTQSPERCKANKAIVALLAESLCLRKSQIELIAGETSPQKRFLVRRITPDELEARIQRALGALGGSAEK